jgi:biopolymer transport protein ExbD
MGMSSGGGTGVRSEINVTPLVDVVLVLLIIFMVIVPLAQLGYEVETPPKVTTSVPLPSEDQLIVRMDAQGNTWLNKEQVPLAQFAGKLRDATRGREKKIVFFAADGELPYEQVAEFLDLVQANGAENVGIVFDDLKSSG